MVSRPFDWSAPGVPWTADLKSTVWKGPRITDVRPVASQRGFHFSKVSTVRERVRRPGISTRSPALTVYRPPSCGGLGDVLRRQERCLSGAAVSSPGGGFLCEPARSRAGTASLSLSAPKGRRSMTESPAPAPAPSFAPFFTDIVAAGMWWPRHTGDGFALDAVSARR